MEGPRTGPGVRGAEGACHLVFLPDRAAPRFLVWGAGAVASPLSAGGTPEKAYLLDETLAPRELAGVGGRLEPGRKAGTRPGGPRALGPSRRGGERRHQGGLRRLACPARGRGAGGGAGEGVSPGRSRRAGERRAQAGAPEGNGRGD